MTTPVPKQPGLAEYKHTKRKKTVYSRWRDIPWDEQKALGGEFKAAGEGRWPVDKIVEERINRKENNRLEYRVLWKRHPGTGELWAPEWIFEDIDNRVVEEWENQKTKKRKRGRPSNGSSVKRLKRARVVRTLSEPSSKTKEQQEDEEAATVNSTIAGEEGDTLDPPPSSIEIAETQQDTSHPADISVNVPRNTVNLDDYESLHSSHLRGSDSAINEVSSPIRSSGKSTNGSSQPAATGVSSNKKINGVVSTSSSSQQLTSSDEIIRPGPSRFRQRSSKKTALTHPQPVTRDLGSSPFSTGPEFVPSTLFNSNEQSLKEPSTLQVSPENLNSGTSTWDLQTQLPSRHLVKDHSQTSASGNILNNQQRSGGTPTHSRSDRSYHSAEQTPVENSPLFCSPDPARPKSASSNSSLGEDFVLDSIESDTRPAPAARDMDLIASPPEPALAPVIAPPATTYDAALGGSALPIQDSIEEEEPSGGDPPSSDSKGSSSQQSLENERDLPQIAGLVQPSLPILGPNEYVLALPCEGKVQSAYTDIIKAKEKSIKKFLSRHESIGSGNGSPNRTHERNEMNEMIHRLHDTVTHIDLGLPGFSTQYSVNPQEHAAYANYAGTKFLFLGYLVEFLHLVGVSIVIMSEEGQIQDLIEQYLRMKPNVVVKRQDRMARSKSPATDRVSRDFQVELVSTWSTHQVDVRSKPALMIAFDASFDPTDHQVARIRARFDRGTRLMPVLHLMTTNSSEHVDLCLPKSLPSPLRLKALVRYTYSALPNLGGKLTYLERESDVPMDRPMDLSDLQRGLRKSPERKLIAIADNIKNAVLSPDFGSVYMPPTTAALELTELDETPSMKPSRTTTRPETPRDTGRSRTPISRADTPSGRKRLLDIDGILPALTKRQRLTPLRDSLDASNATSEPSQLLQLQEQVKKLQTELSAEGEARQAAEQARDHVKEQLTEWQRDHASLQRRYEKRMTKCHELDREKTRLLKAIENNKARHDRTVEDNTILRQKNTELQKQLTTIRDEIKAGGGDAASLETAREEARTLLAKTTVLEKSLENTRKDFEFTRAQYQNASTRATELAGQVAELEADNEILTKQASDEKRRLRAMNHEKATSQHLAKIDQLERERKSRDALLRRVEEENRQLKRNRGVQTRGSSVQPPGSPGMDGGHTGRGTRSRHSSPAPGLVPTSHRVAAVGGSSLRIEQ